jgi:hypothetical protein
MNRQELVSFLSQGVCELTFTKVDGTERTMPCTLKEDLLPKAILTEDKVVPRKLNVDVLRVFVTDINEWRSFRIENFKAIRLIGA